MIFNNLKLVLVLRLALIVKIRKYTIDVEEVCHGIWKFQQQQQKHDECRTFLLSSVLL